MFRPQSPILGHVLVSNIVLCQPALHSVAQKRGNIFLNQRAYWPVLAALNHDMPGKLVRGADVDPVFISGHDDPMLPIALIDAQAYHFVVIHPRS
jgi:hypothetical protein